MLEKFKWSNFSRNVTPQNNTAVQESVTRNEIWQKVMELCQQKRSQPGGYRSAELHGFIARLRYFVLRWTKERGRSRIVTCSPVIYQHHLCPHNTYFFAELSVTSTKGKKKSSWHLLSAFLLIEDGVCGRPVVRVAENVQPGVRCCPLHRLSPGWTGRHGRRVRDHHQVSPVGMILF